LLIAEADLLREVRIIPPAAELTVVESMLHGRSAEAWSSRSASRSLCGVRPARAFRRTEVLGKGQPGGYKTK
jgi:hypothetical protein